MKSNTNIPKTFIFFIAASSFIWLLITFSKEYTTTISYPLSYVNIPQNKLIQETPTKQLELTIKGTGFKILSSKIKRKTIKFDVRTTKRGKKSYYYFLTRDKSREIEQQIHSGLQVVGISKDTIFLNLGSLTTKKIPVKPNLQITYHIGYDLAEQVTIEPDSILVSGPEENLNALKSVILEPLKLKEIKDDFENKVNIVTNKNTENLKFNTKTVLISGKVEKFTEGSLQVPFVIKNLPEDLALTKLTEKVELKFVVALSKFNLISENSFRIVCDYQETQKNNLGYLIPQLEQIPDFIKSYKIIPNKIDFLIRK